MTGFPPPELLSVPVRGGDLTVARWGDGPAVVAPHGITANHVSWARVAEALGDEVTLLAPDLRGRGGSAGLSGPWGLAQHVEDLVAVLDHLGLEQAPIAGHSMGAFVAVKAAGLHPRRFPRLLLIDGGIRIPFEVPADSTVDEVLDAVIGPAMERLRMTLPSREAWLERWRAHPALADVWDGLFDAYVDADIIETEGSWRSVVRIEAIRQDGADTLLDDTLTHTLADGPVPMRVLWAPRGVMNAAPLYPRELVEQRVAALDHLTARYADDVNHYSILMTPSGATQVAEEIRTLVTALRPLT